MAIRTRARARPVTTPIVEDDSTVPVFKDPFFYASRTEKGKQYSIYYRKQALDGPEEVLLDLNTLPHEYMDLGTCKVSPDHKVILS